MEEISSFDTNLSHNKPTYINMHLFYSYTCTTPSQFNILSGYQGFGLQQASAASPQLDKLMTIAPKLSKLSIHHRCNHMLSHICPSKTPS